MTSMALACAYRSIMAHFVIVDASRVNYIVVLVGLWGATFEVRAYQITLGLL